MQFSRLTRSLVVVAVGVLLAGWTGAAGQTVKEEWLKGVNYRSIGPAGQGGRFTDFAVPLQQPYTVYASLGSGGLWKTVNNGHSWEAIFDFEKSYSIGDIAVAPSNPNIVWVGTGEANSSRSTYWGDGMYKSTDAGKTWKNMGLPESHHIARIVIHPSNPDVLYVAALGHLYSENPDRGLYKTSDGGQTWQKVLFVDNRTGCADVVMNPQNPNVLYAAMYDKLRLPWTYQIGGFGSGIHKSTDGGKNWKKLTKGLPSGIIGRIGLTIYPKNPNVLYAVVENANKPGMTAEDRWKEVLAGKSSGGMIDGEVYRTDDGGASWRKVSPEKQSIGSGPGYYYADVIVDPNDDAHVYALTVGVQESKDGGKTWRQAFAFGGDNHALWINPRDSKHILLGYDHGMGITFDAGQNWLRVEHLAVGQFYAVDFDNSYPYRVAGGLQDNGSAMGPSTKKGGAPIRLEDWSTVGGGDGMYNVFDLKTNRFLYNESQFGPLSRLDLATGETKSIRYQKQGLRWNWNSPILVSAFASDTIYHCANIVLKSTNRGEAWTEISPDLTTNDKAKLHNGSGGDGNIQYCTITTISESPLHPGLLWVGTDDGLVWVTRNDGGNWTKVNDKIAGNPGYWVSRVEASSGNPGTAYVSFTGYRHDDFKPFVYKTTDFGQTWASIAANLPNEPINVIREDPKNPNLLFVGTDFAVYASFDGGKAWTKMKGNMPTQPIYDLKIHPRESDLIVATHGRSVYIADISALEQMTPENLSKDVALFDAEPKIRWRETERKHSTSINFRGQSEPAGVLINYFLKAKPKGEVTVQVLSGETVISEMKGTANEGLNSVTWDMMGRRARTEEEKKAAPAGGQRGAFAGGAGGGFQRGGTAIDPNFAYFQAADGAYTLVLIVDGHKFTARTSILPDVFSAK